MLQVDVPRFKGHNVDNWIYNVEKFFNLHQILPKLHLEVVAFHLDGEPAMWYQWMDGNGFLTSWQVFLDELKKCFGALVYDNLLGQIAKLV